MATPLDSSDSATTPSDPDVPPGDASLSDAKDPHVTVPVVFHVGGTWGGRGFAAHLEWRTPEPFFEGFETSAPAPVLVIDGADDPWAGLILTPASYLPGQYGPSYQDERSGKYFVETGDSSIGDSPHSLKPVKYLPRSVFCWPASLLVLHTPSETFVPTPEQRELLLAAIRLDSPSRFAAGATIMRLFDRTELEGAKAGTIFYNRLYPGDVP